MKQQIPAWAIIAGIVAVLALVGFVGMRSMGVLDNDGHGTVTPEDMAKHRGQQAASYGANRPAPPGGGQRPQ
jgi:hypothetical protein